MSGANCCSKRSGQIDITLSFKCCYHTMTNTMDQSALSMLLLQQIASASKRAWTHLCSNKMNTNEYRFLLANRVSISVEYSSNIQQLQPFNQSQSRDVQTHLFGSRNPAVQLRTSEFSTHCWCTHSSSELLHRRKQRVHWNQAIWQSKWRIIVCMVDSILNVLVPNRILHDPYSRVAVQQRQLTRTTWNKWNYSRQISPRPANCFENQSADCLWCFSLRFRGV